MWTNEQMRAIMNHIEFLMDHYKDYGYYVKPNEQKVIKVKLDFNGEAISGTEEDATQDIIIDICLLGSL